ncbi:HNH endonuclease [Sphingomonas oryzagri]|uniref:HNH endonuclease n=1 Tax=Sphingomonas oryzagri TaxID=3042314 RepID=A0ABT6N1G1_9SPHN|nr:HNH endonuclease [Sphingomonas oryzagri]MDH7638923.1 HNH endonuclease [Sphingomonas oryzagri]
MSKQIFTYRERRERKRIRNAVLERDCHICRHCGIALTPCVWGAPRASNTATVDHYPIPKSKGGPFTAENLVACCHACNTARGNGESWSIPRPARASLSRQENPNV